MARIVSKRLGAAGGHSMTADLVEMVGVVPKRFVAAIREVDARDPIVCVAGNGHGLAIFALHGMEVIVVRVGVVDCWPLVLTGRVALGEWKLGLSDVPRDPISGVIGSVTFAIYHVVDVFGRRVVMQLGAMAHEIRRPINLAGTAVNESTRRAVCARFHALPRGVWGLPDSQCGNDCAAAFMAQSSVPISLAKDLTVNRPSSIGVVRVIWSAGFILVGNSFHRP